MLNLDVENYYWNVEIAKTSYKTGKFELSLVSYEMAFAIRPGNHIDLYNAACAASLADKLDVSILLLYKSVERGYPNVNRIPLDPDLNPLISSANWNIVYDDIVKLGEHVEKSHSQKLKQELLEILKDDQDIRKQYIETEIESGLSSSELNHIKRQMLAIDARNADKITRILETHGWPGTMEVGHEANKAAFLVLQHSSIDMQKHYLPLIEKSIDNNNTDPSFFAYLTDRIRVSENGSQIYGTQVGSDSTNGKYYLHHLENPNEVDTLRSSVGLELSFTISLAMENHL